ncbi:SdrD B-like domain-containing protein [Rhodovulum marinum]|uniref:SdrD B-like protein n=1 Tax=Rhodovulum marinum TaxID=320662 RepID=A0A4R2PZ97_9RHOB|nr:SdrD B-like domain-containing protein [Rhodovulum marinum]TCP39551.1 SdrD B-like protein [Rhodovulum marinum]
MTYYYSSYTTYEFTAFSESSLLAQGELGTNVGCGDTFTMPTHADTCISVCDNDRYLSGDACYNEKSDDSYGQQATITTDGAHVGNGGQIYAESYFWVCDQHGNWYVMIEIEQEGASGDYFTFHSGYGMPPAGAHLTVHSECNVSGNWVDYKCLDAGPQCDPNDAPVFDNVPADGEVCIDENTTAVLDLDASDADGDSLTYAIAGGADAALFEIDAHTGELRFKAAPDYEAPADAGGDNVYEVEVKVSDGQGGEQTKLLKVCVNDVDEGTPGGTCTVIEAEDMHLSGYTVEHRSDASDGAGIKLCSSYGYASTTFKGDAGSYDLKISYMDESDGEGWLKVYVNGCEVKRIQLNANDGGDGLDGSSSWSVLTLEDLDLKYGDTITLKGVGDCAEYARIDKIEICEPACAPCVTIEAEDMYAYNYKTVCGAEASGGELVKLKTDWCGGIEDGKLKTTFKGCDGTYDLKILAQDENDGQSTIVVKVNGVEVGTVFLDQDDDGAGDDNGGFSEFTLENIEIGYGDEIALYAFSDGGEYVRIDKIELCKDEEPQLGAIGDTVWFDADGDGIQDASEAGVANVTVTLLDGDGNEVASQATDGNGNYLFEGLAAGDYQVVFELPAGGFAFTTPDAGGDDAADSDADATGATGTITLAAGEENLTVDAGIVELPGSISGRYFCDTNDNDVDDGSVDPGVEGVVVELLDASGVPTGITTTTGANGEYSFTGLEAGTYGVQFTDPDGVLAGKQLVAPNVGDDDTVDSDAIGDTTLSVIENIVVEAGQESADNDAGAEYTASLGGLVFEDLDADGIQDAGETGIEGVTVTLTGGGADGVIGTADDTTATATTDADGEYAFTGLNPGEEYQVSFGRPDGAEVSPADEGTDDTVDSDGLVAPIVTLAPGEVDDTIDQGFYELAELGDFVFLDANDNGIQDEGEAGVENVTVKLFKDGVDTNRSTTTDANGAYSFTGLVPGTYSVMFVAPTGFAFTAANAGTDDARDSDADAVTGMTQEVTVISGEVNGTLDAGLVVLNNDPEPQPDTAKTCADETVTVDVLANDSDPDGDVPFITAVDGQAIAEGGSVTTGAGTVVSLIGGELVINGEAAYADLDIGEQNVEVISYTVSDGNGGSATADVTVTFCGDANSYASLALSLPETANLEVAGALADPGAFDVTVSGSGDARFDGVTFENAYCLSFFDPIPLGQAIPGDVYGTENAGVPGIFDADQISSVNGLTAAENMDLIQYIVSKNWENDPNVDYDGWDVQFAIWELTDDIETADWLSTFTEATVANVDAIIADALANGNDFSFEGDGEIAGMIWDPNPESAQIQQPFIIGFEFDDYDCLC